MKLMPEYLADIPNVKVDTGNINGILQQVNPQATRTTTGCPNKCRFCAVPDIEGEFIELDDWPDLPIICDNNLLYSSIDHFDKVCGRLEKHEWSDFNQGLDARLLNKHHAERLARLPNSIIRLALDSAKVKDKWDGAYSLLRSAGVPKSRIRTYVLIGFDSDPGECWERCKYVDDLGVLALPQWYHELKQMEKNIVTEHQEELGWDDYERRRIMQWFYQHKKAVPA